MSENNRDNEAFYPGQFKPFELGKKFVPPYYRVIQPNPNVGPDADILDLASAFDLNYARGNVIKYVIRAGRKEGEPASKDLSKALEVLQRELMRVQREEKALAAHRVGGVVLANT